MTALCVRASSQAEEAGFVAMRDLAAVADDVGIEYRLIGGQMVRLHVALADVPEPVVRVTQDADMGVAAISARDPALVPGLEARGYTRPGASNRFIRATDAGLRLVIDVLAPAYGRRLIPNQQHGDMVLDEIPGLSLALARPGEQLDLTVTMLDGSAMSFPAVIPDINSALCLKALSWSSRLAAKDAVDVWRLLLVHRQRIPEPVEWVTPASPGRATRLPVDMFSARGRGGNGRSSACRGYSPWAPPRERRWRT